jgi:acetyltransferase-like isoleucine patch superfamily enzyme
VKALKEIGIRRAVRYVMWAVAYHFVYRVLCLSPLRVLWLRMAGARIGTNSVIMDVRFFNLYRGGMRNLRTGRDAFIGDECLLDMAGEMTLGNQVTLAERVTVLTHTNVGYPDHPLQREFPPIVAPVSIGDGSYIGAGAVVLPGVTMGPKTVVGAGAVVTHDVPGGVVVAGVPARIVRVLSPDNQLRRARPDFDGNRALSSIGTEDRQHP